MSPGEFNRMALLKGLVGCGAVQFGSFILASGKTSTYYVDIKKAVTRPALLRMMGDGMAPYARTAERIAGVELGAVPIVAAVSLASGKPFIMVRKATKEHGTMKEFEGELRAGERVLFVEDVVTTGGTLRGAIERMRGHGATIADVVAVVDREEGGTENLRAIGVRLRALLTAKDLLQAK